MCLSLMMRPGERTCSNVDDLLAHILYLYLVLRKLTHKIIQNTWLI